MQFVGRLWNFAYVTSVHQAFFKLLLKREMFEKKNVSEHNFKTQINKSKNYCDDFLYIHISEMKGFGKFFNLGEGGGGYDSTDSILSSYNE